MIEPRPASTVVLMRDSDSGLQVYLMRRHTQMAFVGGAHVFPGGGVDVLDQDERIAWGGPTPEEWAAAMGCSPLEARSYVVAAIREMFEETGVLLAATPDGELATSSATGDWEVARKAVEARELPFADLIASRDLVLQTGLLRYWSRWVTPSSQPKRYDTRFFVAMLPSPQDARHVSTEADHAAWWDIEAAIGSADRGEILLVLPTIETCREIATYANVGAVLQGALTRTPLEML